MSINAQSYIHAAFPKPLRAPRPRCFYLTWDHSKCKTPNPGKNHQLEAIGCQFPNGIISLDNQMGYNTLGEMELALGEQGKYEIIWLDDDSEKQGG